ncbi:hypothetical protein ACCQ08_05390 [Comamonas sp. SY3]|uniref:hypothetical protein n=1 Tax=Comamonas sp. SY3 TaxID=3243601 RepID=UPI0035947718
MRGYSKAAMGGYSLLVLIAVFIGLNEAWIAPFGVLMMIFSNFMNHPHFMASYKLFFEMYPKIKTSEFQKTFQIRWWVAAIIVPLGLSILLVIGIVKYLHGDDFVLTLVIFLYGISVGWHYVKQGFGMAMSEAALKRCYWQPKVRRWMLWNAYACWVFSMCLLFSAEGGVGFLGWYFPLERSSLQQWLLPAAIFFGITSVGVIIGIRRNIGYWRQIGKHQKDWPSAGLMGYLVSLYVWVAIGVSFPLLMLVIPFFHSMQYMHVVEKFYDNKEKKQSKQEKTRRWLYLIGWGFVLFWLIPGVLDYINSGKVNLMSQVGMLFTAAFWLFINIHHYFIDNVIWRKENKYIWESLNAC